MELIYINRQDGSQSVAFSLDYLPHAKGRARITTIGGFPRAFTPHKTKVSMERIKDDLHALRYVHNAHILRGPFLLIVSYTFHVPKSYSKKKREACLSGEIFHTAKPDVNNLNSTILDALSGFLYDDDRMCVDLHARKQWGHEDKTEIIIYGKIDE